MKVRILSWLLYHANRKPSGEFYDIKNRILGKYGEHICYDVQHFNPVECNTCHGTGKFKCSWKLPETCWSCGGTGWYKPESWVILARVRFGNYDCFHRPLNRVTERPEFSNPMIESYIEKTPTKYSEFALFVLFLIYEKGYLKRWYREAGHGWRCHWWEPRNIPSNLVHIIKKGRRAYPFRNIRNSFKKYFSKPVELSIEDDGLPF